MLHAAPVSELRPLTSVCICVYIFVYTQMYACVYWNNHYEHMNIDLHRKECNYYNLQCCTLYFNNLYA